MPNCSSRCTNAMQTAHNIVHKFASHKKKRELRLRNCEIRPETERGAREEKKVELNLESFASRELSRIAKNLARLISSKWECSEW